MFEVCGGLVSRGAKITLVYGAEWNMVPQYRAFCEKLIHAPSPYFFRPSQALTFIKTLLRLAWLGRSSCWDAIYINQFGDAPLAAILGILLRIPVIAHLRLPPGSSLSRQYKFGLRQCTAMIAISRYAKQQYVEAGLDPDKIQVIYNGTDLDHYAPAPAPNRLSRKILFLGRMCPTKGIGTLVDAYASIVETRRDISLTFAGNPNEWSKTSGYLAKLKTQAANIGHDITFLPHQSDVRPLLADTDLLVVPSEWGEPFGRVLIEAMAMGIPVVATRDGGIPEVLSERFAAHLVPPGDPKSLAAAILRFIDWRSEKPGLGHEFRQYAESRFSQKQTHDAIFSVLNRLLKK